MLRFMKNGYTKHDIHVLCRVLEDAKYQIETSWAECASERTKKCCTECSLRTVCKDIYSLVTYLQSVENSMNTTICSLLKTLWKLLKTNFLSE